MNNIQVACIRSMSNDLYADIGPCDCLMFPDVEHLSECKKRFSISGYNDSNFFDNVYASPKVLTCSKCGAKFEVQWKRDGVHWRKL